MPQYPLPMGCAESGQRLGRSPSTEALREEIHLLRRQGLNAAAIGQRIGVYYLSINESRTLDKLETVLAEECPGYEG